MYSRKAIRLFVIVVVLLSNIGCDQISKQVVRNRIGPDESISLGKYVTLMRTENSGAFLSLGNNLSAPLRSFLFIFFPTIILIILGSYLVRLARLSMASIIGICFVLGGGAGNLYDRIVYGSVTDFMHIDFVIFRTGIFNMADVSIMIGIGMIFIDSIFNKATLRQQS
jgi:signal peptidase II